eukprot:5687529-Pyramimonas_sp.AAC.1
MVGRCCTSDIHCRLTSRTTLGRQVHAVCANRPAGPVWGKRRPTVAAWTPSPTRVNARARWTCFAAASDSGDVDDASTGDEPNEGEDDEVCLPANSSRE